MRLTAAGAKVAALHLRYIERHGVELDGSNGVLYCADGPVRRQTLRRLRAWTTLMIGLSACSDPGWTVQGRAVVDGGQNSGAAIAGATVQLKCPEVSIDMSTMTNSDGQFRLSAMGNGVHLACAVFIEKYGYSSQERRLSEVCRVRSDTPVSCSRSRPESLCADAELTFRLAPTR